MRRILTIDERFCQILKRNPMGITLRFSPALSNQPMGIDPTTWLELGEMVIKEKISPINSID